jgi:hypothetical protein
MHSIGFIELGDYQEAADLLHRSYSRYVKEPFNVSQVKIDQISRKHIQIIIILNKKDLDRSL